MLFKQHESHTPSSQTQSTQYFLRKYQAKVSEKCEKYQLNECYQLLMLSKQHESHTPRSQTQSTQYFLRKYQAKMKYPKCQPKEEC